MVLLCNQSLDGGAAVDALLDGLSAAGSRAAGSAGPTAKRAASTCCRRRAPLTWDELMHTSAYQHALERLP